MRCMQLTAGRSRLVVVAKAASRPKPGSMNPTPVTMVPKVPVDPSQLHVEYGTDWYTETRELGKLTGSHGFKTVREELAFHHAVNERANHGKERKSLYTTNWDGAEYKGTPWNIMTLLAALTFFVPIAGLGFAYFTYGTMWGNLTPL